MQHQIDQLISCHLKSAHPVVYDITGLHCDDDDDDDDDDDHGTAVSGVANLVSCVLICLVYSSALYMAALG